MRAFPITASHLQNAGLGWLHCLFFLFLFLSFFLFFFFFHLFFVPVMDDRRLAYLAATMEQELPVSLAGLCQETDLDGLALLLFCLTV